jgi:hypothetical protein
MKISPSDTMVAHVVRTFSDAYKLVVTVKFSFLIVARYGQFRILGVCFEQKKSEVSHNLKGKFLVTFKLTGNFFHRHNLHK